LDQFLFESTDICYLSKEAKF